jgi:putative NADPH-quinone reductase
MKKYLIISANPVYKSTTKLASYALFLKIKKTRSVKFLDLYSKVNAQNFLYFDDINNQIFDKKKERMQQLIMEADEIIFFFPIWWG